MTGSIDMQAQSSFVLIAALEPLTRRGAFADPAGDGLAPVQIGLDRHGEILTVGEMARLHFEAAEAQGLIMREGAGYRISAAGRTAVRRMRSEITRLRAASSPADAATARPDAAPRVNEDESPLSRLARRLDKDGLPLITQEQLAAGEQLRKDLWLARLTPRVTQSWNGIALSRRERRGPPGAGVAVSDSAIAARERAQRALVAAGPEYLDLLFDVCGHLKGLEQIERTANLPQRSARRFLQLALTALARHYGLLPPVDVENRVSSRLRHWGAADYRPTV